MEILQFKTKEEWLAARRNYITASDVPLLCGRNPYALKDKDKEGHEDQIVKLWREKVLGEDKQLDDTPGCGERKVYWGTRLQTLLIEEFNSIDERAFYKPMTLALGVDPDYPWLAASFDATGIYDMKSSVCEVKVVSEFLRPKFITPDGYSAPELYTFQLFTQMLVADFDHGTLLPFIGGNTLAPSFYTSKDLDSARAEILETCEAFYNDFIVTKTEPPKGWCLSRV